MNNVLKGTGYGFDRTAKEEEVFQALECFIDEGRKYSVCIDSGYGQSFVRVLKAFRLFVNSVNGFADTKKEYCKTYEEAKEVWNSLANILKYGSATTISTNVKNFFEKRNFRVTSDEIGWIITC